MITKTGPVLEITAYDPATIETELNRAVELAQAEAIWQGRRGILVTQLGFTSYTVGISSEVPYGQTHERRQRSPQTEEKCPTVSSTTLGHDLSEFRLAT
jgi:hypothetical protein